MRKRFQGNEYGQRIEGDGQVENNSHLSTSHDQPEPINGVMTTKQDFHVYSKENYSGCGNNQSRLSCTETENGSKSQAPTLLPDVARHFSKFVSYEESNQNVSHQNSYINYLSNNSHNPALKARNLQPNSGNNSSYQNNILINNDDDDMLLPRNSLTDGPSKTGLDNPVALGPDQGYPKGCETTRGPINKMVRSSSSQFQLGRTDQISNHSFMNEAERNIMDNNERKVWTKLYGNTTSAREEETCLNSSQQSSRSVQAFSVDHIKSADHLSPHTASVLTNENHSMKSDEFPIQKRPINGSFQFDKYNAIQNLSSNIISATRTKSETRNDGQKEEKEFPGKSFKVNYQPTAMTSSSSDGLFLDVMNNSKTYDTKKGSFHRKHLPATRNKTSFQNYSPVVRDQSQNQFIKTSACNLEESDQSVLDIDDSIFDYLATGSISEHSSIPARLPVRTTALSSSVSGIQASKSASSDENQSRLDNVVHSANLDDRKPMHTKMLQLPPKSSWQQDREAAFHVNFNLPNKKIFTSRLDEQNQKDACTDDGSMSFDIDDTILTVESIESDTERLKVLTNISTIDEVKEQLDHLTFMYQQLYHLINRNKKLQNPNDLPWSIGNSNTNSMTKTTHLQRRKSMRSSILESKHNKKHFQRLEAHVVTLVRSVASLTSQLRVHANALKQIDVLKEEFENLKITLAENNNHNGNSPFPNKYTEYERFRGWIPSLTNPRRVRKLTKFFGQEPPLLEIFLKKLGYERYTSNFSNEHIGMIELPYMTEERLQRIGIPMGPRLRILQESQLCFRQENFNIYII